MNTNDSTPTPAARRDMTSSETPPDAAPPDEGIAASIGRAIGEVVTVPAGPDSVDPTPTETRDTPGTGTGKTAGR